MSEPEPTTPAPAPPAPERPVRFLTRRAWCLVGAVLLLAWVAFLYLAGPSVRVFAFSETYAQPRSGDQAALDTELHDFQCASLAKPWGPEGLDQPDRPRGQITPQPDDVTWRFADDEDADQAEAACAQRREGRSSTILVLAIPASALLAAALIGTTRSPWRASA